MCHGGFLVHIQPFGLEDIIQIRQPGGDSHYRNPGFAIGSIFLQ